jgi:hypothetical protein
VTAQQNAPGSMLHVHRSDPNLPCFKAAKLQRERFEACLKFFLVEKNEPVQFSPPVSIAQPEPAKNIQNDQSMIKPLENDETQMEIPMKKGQLFFDSEEED